MTQTWNLPETIGSPRAPWVGRVMSGFVVVALVADGTIQLFAPAQIASMLQETGFAMDLTRIVGPVVLACALLYVIPATAVLGAILVTGFLGGAICAHVRNGELGSPPELICLLLGAMTWAGLYARDPRIRALPSARPLNQPGLCPLKIRRKRMFLVMGITGKVGGATAEHLLAHARTCARWSAIAKRHHAGRTGAWNWSTVIGMIRPPLSSRSKASKAHLSCCRPYGPPRPIIKKLRA